MMDLIKEVGRGRKGARDLTPEEARRAAELILSREASAVQIGAFLMAERIKTESAEELTAFVEACRARSRRWPMAGGIDCAGPYDGRRTSFAATVPAAFVLASCGLPVTLHGSAALPPKWGITLPDVFAALGADLTGAAGDRLAMAAESTGFLFAPTEKWCPALAGLRRMREDIGVRTIFNTAEKLLRFSDAPYMAMGVFHGTMFEKMAGILLGLGVRNAIIVQGVEGSEDLSVEKRTRTVMVRGGQHHEMLIIDPAVFGLEAAAPEMEWSAERQAETARGVLEGGGGPPSGTW
ncbi:anthranilate phosphoribosyltransferase [Paenibacillus sp. CC-CFT747]|nr:anthranilate phosphoribosyltransferase [Paenibacillus sp. CC-CFT747]